MEKRPIFGFPEHIDSPSKNGFNTASIALNSALISILDRDVHVIGNVRVGNELNGECKRQIEVRRNLFLPYRATVRSYRGAFQQDCAIEERHSQKPRTKVC